jgi:predicted branched-subunit amino acid permease
MTLILQHPWRHLALIIPFLWRGATFVFPILIVVLVIAVRRRREDLAVFALPAFGLVVFFALFSHFIARYALPAREVATVSLIALVAFLCLPKTNNPLSG